MLGHSHSRKDKTKSKTKTIFIISAVATITLHSNATAEVQWKNLDGHRNLADSLQKMIQMSEDEFVHRDKSTEREDTGMVLYV